MNEIWKEIDWISNLRGTYEVSNLGNVRRTSFIWYDYHKKEYRVIHKIRNLYLYDNGHGYLHVSFPINTEKGRKLKNYYVHQLVAIAFIPNPLNKPYINHKNFIRTDNKVTNLEWCTYEENMAHSFTMDNRIKPYYPTGKYRKHIDGLKDRKEKNRQFSEYKVVKKQKQKTKKTTKHINKYRNPYITSKKPFEERNIFYENGKYTVRIGFNKKKIYVGRYKNYTDAVEARIKKLKELNLLN